MYKKLHEFFVTVMHSSITFSFLTGALCRAASEPNVLAQHLQQLNEAEIEGFTDFLNRFGGNKILQKFSKCMDFIDIVFIVMVFSKLVSICH